MIDTRKAIDKVAKVVTSMNNDVQTEFKCNDTICSMSPLPTIPYDDRRFAENLTGVKFGRFVVIGIALFRTKEKVNSTRWVARCTCGRYQMFKAKTIKSHKGFSIDGLKCVECKKLYQIRNHMVYSETGVLPKTKTTKNTK